MDGLMEAGEQRPGLWMSLDPSCQAGSTISELVREGSFHRERERIFWLKNDCDDVGSLTSTLHLGRVQCHVTESA